MTKRRSTKSALFTSVMALVLCISMLMGTTFAWFTDSVTSANNVITSGNLDITLEYYKNGKWNDVKDASDILAGDLWEPGYVDVAYLRIKNAGSLALKYQLGVNIVSEKDGTNVNNESFKLSDYIYFDVKEGVDGQNDPFADRDAAMAIATETTKISAGYSKADKLDAGSGYVYLAMVVYMPESVGNVANHNGTDIPKIDLGVQVLATQYIAESDSFDNTYDEDAALGTYIELEAGADLLGAMANAEADMPLTIKLNGDVDWPTEGHHGENDITPASAIVIDGNGYTITATGSGVTPLGDQTAPMTLKNVTIVDNSVSYKESAWEFTYLEMGGSTLTCNNVTFKDEIQTGTNATFTNCSFESNEESVYAVWVEDGSATFTNCTFTGYRGLKMHEAYGTEVSSVVVKNCAFNAITKKPGIAIGTVNADTTVSITDSTFIQCQPGDQNLYIYETDTDVTTFNFVEKNNMAIGGTEIAEGVYENGTRNYYVYNAEGLQNVFAEVIPVNVEQSQTVNLMADVDLKGIVWQPINNMHFTFNGNGHTISNVNCAEGWRSGFFGYAGGVKVNDLTLENVTSIGAQAGTFAGSTEGLTTTNCFLKGTNSVTYKTYKTTDYEETYGGIGAVTGVLAYSNINVTIVEGTTVTLDKGNMTTNCTFYDNLTGYLNPNNGTVVNNGTVTVAVSVSDQDGLNSIVSAGNAVDINLAAGSYKMPGVSNKDVTISGTKETVIDVKTPNCGGSNVTLNGVTVKGNGTYTGIQHVDTVTYNNVTVEGEMCLYGNKVVFNNCTFNLAADQYIWTYGATVVEFNNCTFNSQGKALLVYGDSPQDLSTTCTTYINNCKFNAETAVAGKAAIEIDSRFINQIVYIDELTTAEGFDNGNISGNDLWNNKKGNAAKVYVNNVEQTLNEAPNS